MNKKSGLNKFFENWLPIIILMVIAFIFLKKDSDVRFYQENLMENLKDTVGATQEFSGGVLTGTEILENTGTIINGTGVIIEKPLNPRDLLDYQIEYGEGGVDYIVATPTNQPKINSKTSKENNDKMHNYLYYNRIKFDIKDTSREGYIMFVISKPVKSISNVFIGLDGSTIGWLDKFSRNRATTKKDDEFIYPLNSLDLVGNNNYHFSKDLSKKSTISINAVIGEENNKIEKIIIFFR